MAQQPAPQCFLLTKSESRIERGSEVSAESPKTSKKEGRAAADPQLTQSSDDEEKPSLAKFPKRKILTKTKKTSLSSTSKRRSILESTESAKHSKHEGRTGNETPKQLKEEPPNMTDSSEEEVKDLLKFLKECNHFTYSISGLNNAAPYGQTISVINDLSLCICQMISVNCIGLLD